MAKKFGYGELQLSILKKCAAQPHGASAIAQMVGSTNRIVLSTLNTLMHKGFIERQVTRDRALRDTFASGYGGAISSYIYRTTPEGARWALEQIEKQKVGEKEIG